MNTPRVTPPDGVVKRSYRSGVRAAHADATRRSIVSAASRLFAENGYGATTIDAVAEAAGVSRKTVFTAVGGKAALLEIAVDWAVAGDDEPVAVADRDRTRALLANTDPAALIAGWVRFLVEVDTRVARLFQALEIAADSDTDAAGVLERVHRRRLVDARLMVARLAELGALTGAVSRTHAVDVAWLATDPVLFLRLVNIRGWTTRTFEAWLRRSLVDQLVELPS